MPSLRYVPKKRAMNETGMREEEEEDRRERFWLPCRGGWRGVKAGLFPRERLTGNTGTIVDVGVMFPPQCSRACERGRKLEGVKVLTGLCRNTRR